MEILQCFVCFFIVECTTVPTSSDLSRLAAYTTDGPNASDFSFPPILIYQQVRRRFATASSVSHPKLPPPSNIFFFVFATFAAKSKTFYWVLLPIFGAYCTQHPHFLFFGPEGFAPCCGKALALLHRMHAISICSVAINHKQVHFSGNTKISCLYLGVRLKELVQTSHSNLSRMRKKKWCKLGCDS